MKGLFLALVGVLFGVFLGCLLKGGIDDDWKPIVVFFIMASIALIFLGGVVFGAESTLNV